MFKLVCCPVTGCSTSRQIIVCQATCPHNLGTMYIILRFFQYFKNAIFYRTENTFSNGISHRHIIIMREITFHGMHHNVRYTTSCLIVGQCISPFRIHHSKLATAQIIGITFFQITVLIGYHGTVTHFTPRSRNCQYGSNRQTSFRMGSSHIKIPDFTLIRYTKSNRLRRINHTTATYGKNEINLFFPTQFNTLVYFRQTWIRNHPAQFYVSNAFRLQCPAYFIQQTGTLRTLSTIMYQDFSAAILLHQFPCFIFR